MATAAKSKKPWLRAYGPSTKPEIAPLPYPHLPSFCREIAKIYANQVSQTLVLPNGASGTLTFKEVNDYSDDLAIYLRETLGLNPGDRVAVQMPNCLAYPVVAFGVAKAGLILVNTNPLYTVPEMIHQFEDCQSSVLIIMDMFGDKVAETAKRVGIKHVILTSLVDFFPVFRRTLIGAVLKYVKKQIPKCDFPASTFREVLKLNHTQKDAALLESYVYDLKTDDVALFQYTGGTTGISKAAMLTHGNLLSNVAQVLELCGQSIIHGKELLLTALPLYHIFSFMMNFLTFWFAGANSVLCPSPRPIKNLQVIFKNYKITWMSGVNTLFNSLLGEKWFHQKPPKKLKFAVAGGMSLHSSVAERWERTSRSQIAEGYGLSECSPVLAFNPLGQRVKRDSIGVPLPSTDLLIVDDKGRALPAGKEGELLARGPQVMKGYWNNPSETKKVFVNGWFKTGDMAVMDVDGYFKIVDRKKDMIVVSGFKVFPNEVEECLTRHPGVAEAAVIGVPDAHSGEVPKAFVVLKDPKVTPAMLIAHCKSSLASYKIPHQFEFRTDLPKSTIGKILRKNLRTGNVPLVKPVAVRVVKKKKAVAHKK